MQSRFHRALEIPRYLGFWHRNSPAGNANPLILLNREIFWAKIRIKSLYLIVLRCPFISGISTLDGDFMENLCAATVSRIES
jgi:hypothetical protein